MAASERLCPHCRSPNTAINAAAVEVDDEAGQLVQDLIARIEQEAQAMRDLL
jgi:hypothetical protein